MQEYKKLLEKKREFEIGEFEEVDLKEIQTYMLSVIGLDQLEKILSDKDTDLEDSVIQEHLGKFKSLFNKGQEQRDEILESEPIDEEDLDEYVELLLSIYLYEKNFTKN